MRVNRSINRGVVSQLGQYSQFSLNTLFNQRHDKLFSSICVQGKSQIYSEVAVLRGTALHQATQLQVTACTSNANIAADQLSQNREYHMNACSRDQFNSLSQVGIPPKLVQSVYIQSSSYTRYPSSVSSRSNQHSRGNFSLSLVPQGHDILNKQQVNGFNYQSIRSNVYIKPPKYDFIARAGKQIRRSEIYGMYGGIFYTHPKYGEPNKGRLKPRKLNWRPEHARELMSSLLQTLIKHQRVETSKYRAHELCRLADRAVTHAKRADDYSMNWLKYWVFDEGLRNRLLLEMAVRYKDRNGGYTRKIMSRATANEPLDKYSQLYFVEFIDRHGELKAPRTNVRATSALPWYAEQKLDEYLKKWNVDDIPVGQKVNAESPIPTQQISQSGRAP